MKRYIFMVGKRELIVETKGDIKLAIQAAKEKSGKNKLTLLRIEE